MCPPLPAAFDKDDLLYLRDKEQEQRGQEQHKRDAEAAAFAAARARAEQEQEQRAAAKLRQQEALLPEAARWVLVMVDDDGAAPTQACGFVCSGVSHRTTFMDVRQRQGQGCYRAQRGQLDMHTMAQLLFGARVCCVRCTCVCV